MMKLVFVLCVLFVGVESCRDSYDCGPGSCCVDSNGHILSSQQFGGFGPVGNFPSAGTVNGTCITRKAQKGEMCDTDCRCDVGLKCYRPMSGVCCPPMLCYDEAYVIKQQQYWDNCMKNPHCALPP